MNHRKFGFYSEFANHIVKIYPNIRQRKKLANDWIIKKKLIFHKTKFEKLPESYQKEKIPVIQIKFSCSLKHTEKKTFRVWARKLFPEKQQIIINMKVKSQKIIIIFAWLGKLKMKISFNSNLNMIMKSQNTEKSCLLVLSKFN